MTKTELIRFDHEHCAECSHIDGALYGKWRCSLKRRIVPNLWGKIPDWCPLPDKEK